MELQDKYDELDNIISTLDVLIDDIKDSYYIDVLNSIKYEAQNELDEVQKELSDEYEREEREQEYKYIRSVI